MAGGPDPEETRPSVEEEPIDAPDQIGAYHILDLLGEGGMGSVFLAEQKQPVRRRVALKVIKLGMDTKAVLRRFEAERQALAMMENSYIAKVLDAGAAEDGRPWFAMEYVQGVPITQYCDERKLSIGDRLQLFLKVCVGVQHAHQKGVIHRDLKPSNILITEADGGPTPKIIDFGLARATNHQLIQETIYTEVGQFMGTPEYMSPEQAGYGGLDIDTRTDIYSLGVMLYELLVGAQPFPSSELRQAGFEALKRMIREQDPPRPSTRLTNLGEENLAIAKRRRTDIRGLRQQLRGELDWVIMRALEKDRMRRYATALELAADVERSLRHEPVLAGPPNLGYRLRKFLRRYRVQVGAAALVFLVLIAGIVAVWSQYRRAESRLADFNLLAQVVKLREAKAEEPRFYPAWPEQAKDMHSWLEAKAQPLVATLPAVEETLARLRLEAHPYSEEQRLLDRKNHPGLPKLAERQGERDRLERLWKQMQGKIFIDATEKEEVKTQLEQVEQEIAKLKKTVETRLTYEFDSDRDQFLHDTIAKLVLDLQLFGRQEFEEVLGRLRWAESIEGESITKHRETWTRAIGAIAKSNGVTASAGYGNLHLQPQLGLVPLGMDPESKLWEFGHLRSGQLAERDQNSGRLKFTEESGMVFVLIPGGSFNMGAQRQDPIGANFDAKARPHEAPVHAVELEAFFLSKYEMTQGQWQRLNGSRPSFFKPPEPAGRREVDDTHPVESVSWVLCVRLLQKHGLLLPTEAQWEYACRAGTDTPWWTGDRRESLAGAANLADRTAQRSGARWPAIKDWPEYRDGHVVHAPVQSLRANAFGLHHVHGNVWEWCRDCYSSYEMQVAAGDGLRQKSSAEKRVARGGGFNYTAGDARSSNRSFNTEGSKMNSLGCRPSRRLLR